jgi:hypothetical protein
MKSGPNDVALAATLHDATGALADDIARALPRLQRLYAHVAVATSPPTTSSIVRLLIDAGAHAGTPPANTRGPLYRLALRRALASGASRVHYLDFDRAIHWKGRELPAIVRVGLRHDALWIGRTAKAHRTHHLPLHATETVVNQLFARELGIGGRVDFMVPSFILDRARTETLLRRSRARDAAMYGEWAALLAGIDPAPAYIECRGLDWETPDRFRKQVRRMGRPAWKRKQETPAEWSLRIEMAAAFVRGFHKTLQRCPARDVRLTRLPPRA